MVEKTEPSRVWKLGGPESGDGDDGDDVGVCVCVCVWFCLPSLTAMVISENCQNILLHSLLFYKNELENSQAEPWAPREEGWAWLV